MSRRKIIYISIFIAVFILSFFSIFILKMVNTTVDKNDGVGSTVEESSNVEDQTINIPEYFSNILSKDNLIDKVTTKYSVLYGDNKDREMYVFSVPIIEEKENIKQMLKNDICEKNEVFSTQNQQFNVSFEKNLINMKNGKKNISLCLDNFTTFEKIYNYEKNSFRILLFL